MSPELESSKSSPEEATDLPSAESPAPFRTESSVSESDVLQRRFLVLAGGLCLAVMTWRYLSLALEKPEPLSWRRGDAYRSFQVDVNAASWVEWMQLEGIGQTMAYRIVADREIHGPFTSIDDLIRVDGIGTTTLDRIRPWLTIRHEQFEPAQSVVADDQLTERPARSFTTGP